MNTADQSGNKQEVSLWLEKRGIPYQSYKNLSAHDKVVLHNLVCTSTYSTTYAERRDLYRKLYSPAGIAGRDSIDPVDSMTDENLRTFFSPLTPSQGRLLDDWGC